MHRGGDFYALIIEPRGADNAGRSGALNVSIIELHRGLWSQGARELLVFISFERKKKKKIRVALSLVETG